MMFSPWVLEEGWDLCMQRGAWSECTALPRYSARTSGFKWVFLCPQRFSAWGWSF